jgi:ABC-type transport system involved in multi-copper enzyme maturation permease subunit
MLKTVGGVIVGYLVMFFLVFILFSAAYLAMGANGAFQPGSYEVTPLWLVASFVLSLVVAIVGGFVCGRIAPNSKAPVALAGLVIVLGLLLAIPTLMATDTRPTTRDANVGNLEAMTNARQPSWVAFLNPVIGAIGVMIGARRKPGV